MRHTATILLALLLLCSCATQQESVNDKKTITVARVNDNNFRAYLLDNGYAKPYMGKLRGRDRLTPQDEWVESTPLGRSTQLIDCHRKEIHSLDGIELFPKLVILICSENPISRLDLRHNPKLKQLVAIETPLRSLDISHNTELKVLNISFHQLRRLDISHNTQLEELLCIFAPGITSLDLSHNPNLRTLYIRQTNIQLVDLRCNNTFHALHALETPLEYIVVSPQHNLDSITASVEEGVQVLTLSPTAKLPKTQHLDLPDTLPTLTPQHQTRVQRVMTHAQAAAEGINEEYLREVEYRPAWTIDTATKSFEKWGMIRSDKQLVQFILTWKIFLEGISEEMAAQNFEFDKPYRGHCVVFFAEDGYADYFLYNFLGDERPTEEQQHRFEQVLQKYIENSPIGFYGSRKFSQCGGITFQPGSIKAEEE
ncbi:MAG: hypothetical protein IKH33_01330 [Bacteroidales bacterium]|nr:hypothetical protein [Bacteroidales bacterium]